MITKSIYSAILNANKVPEYISYNQFVEDVNKYFTVESFNNNKDKAFKLYYFVLLSNRQQEAMVKFQDFQLKKQLIKEVSND